MKIVLDIETIPAPQHSESALRELYNRRPGRSRSFGDYLRSTSLNGNWGQVLCIGVATNNQEVEILIAEDEPELLVKFWAYVEGATTLIGHNLLEFDLPFLRKRSIIHGIKPSIAMGQLTTSNLVFDTMKEWGSGNYPYTSLHELAVILGITSSKQGIDGSMVYDYWKVGRLEEIYRYCSRDVEVTREIYKRITFATN